MFKLKLHRTERVKRAFFILNSLVMGGLSFTQAALYRNRIPNPSSYSHTSSSDDLFISRIYLVLGIISVVCLIALLRLKLDKESESGGPD